MKRIIAIMLCMIMAIGCLSFITSAAGETLEIDYSKLSCGVVDPKINNHSTVKANQTKDDRNVVEIVPNPDGTGSLGINIDAYGLDKFKIDCAKYKYLTIEYYYATPDQKANGNMHVNFLSNRAPFSKTIGVNSNETLVANKWTTATFNFGSQIAPFMKPEVDPAYIWQFHFYPYGYGTRSSSLSENDVMYIGKFIFSEDNPNPDAEYTVTFGKGGNAIQGTEIVLTQKAGDEITLPECPYYLDDTYEFTGWFIGTNVNTLYKPGEKYIVPDQNTVFTASWKIKVNYPDIACLHYPDYYGGVVDGKIYDVVVSAGKDTVGGLETIKFVPNPNSTKPDYFGFDGWQYGGANIDLSQYKYAAIVYYFGTENDYGEIKPVIRILRSSTVTKSLMVEGTPLEYGKWSYSLFDLNEQAQYLASNPNLIQMHVLPIGTKRKVTELSDKDEICLSKIVFMKEKPEPSTFAVHTAFITGYNDGTFRPNKTMSRAEACTIITRLLTSESSIKGKYESKFTDVVKGQWYYDNIAYLENNGILSSYSGKYEPNKEITRAEFAELVYNTNLSKKTDKQVTFTDVANTHPKYDAIMAAASAGIVGGYPDGSFQPDRTITRAQVVTVINNALQKKVALTKEIEELKDTPLYTDVANDHWAYLHIMEASINHGTASQNEKGEEWFFAITPDVIIDSAPGLAKLAEVDKLTAERIAEIKNTKTAVEVTGTKYYVSSSTGNDANDGKSPESAWKTLAKASDAPLSKGDGVFFKRGDTFRGSLKTRPYVTYSAYGEGEKPILMRSHENGAGENKWSLVAGTTNIWKYYKDVPDMGGLVYNDGEGIFEKICFPFNDNGFYLGSENVDVIKYLAENKSDLICFNNYPTTDIVNATGEFLVRCDAGNPGKIYNSLEFLEGGGHVISAVSNVTIDNLCVKYGARHGIGAGTVSNLIITNCEIGWIGGGFQNHQKSTYVRYGNGIEVYGGCDNFVIDNCYVYQCYDAGITNQLQKGGNTPYTEENVKFTNNVIEDCCYNIEYFMGISDSGTITRLLKNIEYSNNILRRAGYGWGRGLNPSNASHLKGWDHYNQAENFVVKNNIFDRSTGTLMHVAAGSFGWLPAFEGNTYIEHQGRTLAQFGAMPSSKYHYNAKTAQTLAEVMHEKNASVYFLDPIE